MHVPWPRVWKLWQLLGAQFFGTMVLMKFVLKNLCQQLCIFSGLPANEAMHVPSPNVCKSLKKAWAHSFSAQSHSWSLSWKPGLTALLLSMRLPPNRALPKVFPTVSHPSTMSTLPSRSLPMQLSPIYFPRFPIRPRCPRFLPTELSPSIRPQCPRFRLPPSQQLSPRYFRRLPIRPRCPRFRLAPSHRALPWLFPTASRPSTLSPLPSRSLPIELSPSYYGFGVHASVSLPPNGPLQAISHGFLSIHDVRTSISLPPNGALPELFPTISRPSTVIAPRSTNVSSLPSPSLPTKLSPSYFPRFPAPLPKSFPMVSHPSMVSNGALPKLFPTVSRPSTHVHASQRSSPMVFPSVHPLITSTSLLHNGAVPKLFPTVSRPSTLSSLPSRSLPTELSPSYFARFPVRPPCRRSHLAPSQRSSKLFPTVSRPSTMSTLPSRSLPTGLSPSYFPRFPVRPLSSLPVQPMCHRFHLPPSQQSSPQAISHAFPPLSPSHFPWFPIRPWCPTELSPSYFPRFPVRPPMSTPPNGALPWFSRPSTLSSLPPRSFTTELSPSYFPRFPVRPPYRRFHLAPFQRSCPQAISHGFPSVHPVVAPISLPPNGALSYFPRFPVRPPCPRFHLAPSQRSSLPKLFPTVVCPSTPYRSPAAKQTKREPKHRRCFWEKLEIMKIDLNQQFNQLFE